MQQLIERMNRSIGLFVRKKRLNMKAELSLSTPRKHRWK
jgi:hypothetical protein